MFKSRRIKTHIVLVIILALTYQVAIADRIYVDVNVTSPGSGTNWSSAYRYLQMAINSASAGDEIWVAQGTYHPSLPHGGGTINYASYQMKDGVSIYGGFEAGVDLDFEDRNWQTNPVILSGNNGDPASSTDDSYHVIYNTFGLALDATAVLDGFTITEGNAVGTTGFFASGAGMYNDECSPTIRNCTFIDNTADQDGAGMFNINFASPVIENCHFIDNIAGNSGGGMANWFNSSPEVSVSFFVGNICVENGGGMMNYMTCSPTVTMCTFINNKATNTFSDGGGMFNYHDSSAEVTSCLFAYNYAYRGGGMINLNTTSLDVVNCTFYANWSTEDGGGIRSEDAGGQITNCILWDNFPNQIHEMGTPVPTVGYSDVKGTYPGTGNINSNPGFVHVPNFLDLTVAAGATDALHVSNSAGYSVSDKIEYDNDRVIRTITAIDTTLHILTFDPPLSLPSARGTIIGGWGTSAFVSPVENMHLSSSSSDCVDSGTNFASPMPDYDIDYFFRILDGNVDDVNMIDMGADEYFEGAIFVDIDARGLNNGTSWFHAYNDLQDGIDDADVGENVWAAEGSYLPTDRFNPSEPRSACFQMKNRVSVYGGFDPTSGIVLFDDRDWQTCETILNGDLDGTEAFGSESDYSNNSIHVLYHPSSLGIDTTALLDGFIIKYGSATVLPAGHFEDCGGGIYNNGASPCLVGCKFQDNRASNGGGMYNDNASSPELTDCEFMGNDSSVGLGHGGGMYNMNSSPVLTSCTFGDAFQENTSHLGGAIYNNNSTGIYTSCIIRYNEASAGGGMYNDNSSIPVLDSCHFGGNTAGGTIEFRRGGGMYCANSSSAALTGCTFHGNKALWVAAKGGGMYIDSTSRATISGCTFDFNNAVDKGGGIYFDNCTINSIVNDNTVFIDNGVTGTNSGGAVYFNGSTPEFTECMFDGNEAGEGGALELTNSAEPVVTNCRFENNEAGRGGAIRVDDSSNAEFTGCVFISNTATGGLRVAGAVFCGLASPVFDGCTFKTNIASDVGGAVVNDGELGTCSPTYNNCTFGANETTSTTNGTGGAMFNFVSTPVISGCTFEDNEAAGKALGTGGGGIANKESSPEITGCIMRRNISENIGGGILNFDSTPEISGCIIRNNTAVNGGGIGNTFSSGGTITDCLFVSNQAVYTGTSMINSQGGGLYNSSSSAVVILRCKFDENTADVGGAAFNYSNSPAFTNCLFIKNTALFGGGMSNLNTCAPVITNCTFTENTASGAVFANGGGICNENNSSPVISNCIMFFDLPNEIHTVIDGTGSSPVVTYSDIEGGYGVAGDHNIDIAPQFTDAATEDYSLLPGSDCIDAGNNAAVPAEVLTDILGNDRIVDGDCSSVATVDMGAYEFGYANLGSFDGDCDVDLFDFSIFSRSWMTEPADPDWNEICDLENDDIIDVEDLAELVKNWLSGTGL